MGQSIIVHDADGKVVLANEQAAATMGFASPDDLVGLALTDLLQRFEIADEAGESIAPSHLPGARARAGAAGKGVLRWRLRGAPDERWAAVESSLVDYAADGQVLVVSVFHDISEQVRAQEEVRFQSRLLDAVGQAVVAIDLEGRVSYWNRAAEEMLGWSRGEVLGARVRDATGDDVIEGDIAAVLSHLRAGDSWAGEFRVRRRDGVVFPVFFTASPIRDEKGRLAGMIGVAVDISARRRSEQRVAAQYAVSRALAEAETIEQAAGDVLAAFGEHLDWEVGAFWQPEGEDHVLRCIHVWEAPGIDASTVFGASNTVAAATQGLPAAVWQTHEPVWAQDFPAGGWPRSEDAAVAGLRSALAFPVRIGPRVLGVVEFFTATPRPRDDDLIQVAETIGSQFGHFLERKRIEYVLREEEERYRRLVDLSPEPIFVHQDSILVYVNEAAANLLGAGSPADLAGRNVFDFVHPDFHEMVHSRIDRIMRRGGLAELVEEKFVRLDGSLVDVEVVAMRTVFHDQPAYQAMVRDVSERKIAQQALREAEEKYRGIFENALYGVFQTTPDGRFISANPALARMFGFESPEELISGVTDIGRQIHTDPARRRLLIAELEEYGVVHNFEAQAVRRDGALMYISLAGRVLRDDRGEVLGYEGMVADITEHKRAEAQLREQKLILETSERVGALVASELDLAKTAQAVIDAATTLTGATLGAFFYRPIGEESTPYRYGVSGIEESIFAGLPLPTESALFEPVLHGRSIIRIDDVFEYEDLGRKPPFSGLPESYPGVRSYLAVPVFSPRSGFVLGGLFFGHPEVGVFGEHQESLALSIARWAGIAIENARLFAESQEVQEVLRKTNEAKDEFLGVISHELRTPITTIYGGARLVHSRGERLDPQQRNEVIADIERESERLYRLVEDLLALSRLELGETVVLAPVDLGRLIDKVRQAFNRRRPNREIQVRVQPGAEKAQAEPTYVEQVLRNLLSNADKYSPNDQPVTIEATASNGTVTVSVLDRGPGIQQEEAELIFDRFYRSQRTAKQASGIGVGLTVCKRLIEAQSGKIWANPRPEGGLEISFTLAAAEEPLSVP